MIVLEWLRARYLEHDERAGSTRRPTFGELLGALLGALVSRWPSQSIETGVLRPDQPPEDCPDADKLHTPSPVGYLQWHWWAEKKMKTHRQILCPTCGRLAIWVPK